MDLVVLDQRVGEQRLAHRGDLPGVLDLELDQPPDVDLADAGEAERRERALHGLALRVEDPGLGADEDGDAHQGAVRASQASKDSPVISS